MVRGRAASCPWSLTGMISHKVYARSRLYASARTPQNWRSSLAFFVPFRRHFNDKQLAKVIFGSSAEVCIQRKSGKWRWEAMISPPAPSNNRSRNFRGVRTPLVPLTSYAPARRWLSSNFRTAIVVQTFQNVNHLVRFEASEQTCAGGCVASSRIRQATNYWNSFCMRLDCNGNPAEG